MSAGFDAFISYRRSDGGEGARLLRRLLQDYRPPKSLRAHVPKHLTVYLDRIYERGTNDFFEGTILPALRASRYLVVLLTPDAADRPHGTTDWMRRELEEFEAGPNAGNVVAVLVAGALEDRRPALLMTRYPNIEIIDMRGLGPLAFFSQDRATRLAEETVKLVAPLLGLGSDDMPALHREEERRRQSRLGLAAGVAAAFLVASAGLSAYALHSRNRAIDALARSLFAADRIIQSAAASMRPGDEQSQMLMTSCDLLDSLRAEAERPPSSLSLVICARQRASSRDRLNERPQAAAILAEAARLVRTRFAQTQQADDGTALIEADVATLEHLASEPQTPDLAAPIAAFVDETSEVARKLEDDKKPPRTAADALQTLAVFLGDKGLYQPALRAIDGSISLRQISIDRKSKGYGGDMVDNARAYALKAALCQRAGDHPKRIEALARVAAVLAAIPQSALDEPGLRERVDQARRTLGDTAPRARR